MPGFAAVGSTTTGRDRPYAWHADFDRPYGVTWADIEDLNPDDDDEDEDPALYDVPGYS